MNLRNLRYLTIFIILLALFFSAGKAEDQGGTSSKDGPIVVEVTWDDAHKTPATGVYIEAYSFAANYVSEKSFVLKMVKAGRYEAALPPGVYDLFVSEASSTPRCRRVFIKAGRGLYWKLMLEHDDLYLQN